MQAVRQAADTLRRRVCGDMVSYVVNRNINYTNVCAYKCQFCAFSKGKARVFPPADIRCRRSAAQWRCSVMPLQHLGRCVIIAPTKQGSVLGHKQPLITWLPCKAWLVCMLA
jgi:hypothetical protein